LHTKLELFKDSEQGKEMNFLETIDWRKIKEQNVLRGIFWVGKWNPNIKDFSLLTKF